jgi:hypothetical protein
VTVETNKTTPPDETTSQLLPKAEILARFRETLPPWQAWMFVGCGGNYYYAQPQLHVLARGAETAVWVDPDVLEPRNQERQWPMATPLTTKVGAARLAWTRGVGTQRRQGCQTRCLTLPVEEVVASQPWKRLRLRRGDQRTGLVVVCLPDNDAARLASTELADAAVLTDKVDHAAVVVAGTDLTHGQCYYGLRDERGWLHDWRQHHADLIGQTTEEGRAGCGQRPSANLQTAVIIGQCLEEALHAKGPDVHEFHWGIRPGEVGDRIQAWQTQCVNDDGPVRSGGGG